MDDEYKSFLAELGGGPQDQGGPSGMRHMGGGGGGGGGGGRQSRPGDDLPDNCKLYVGNLSPAVTDAVLKSLMEPFGNVLHAVVLLDMTSGMLLSVLSLRWLLLFYGHCLVPLRELSVCALEDLCLPCISSPFICCITVSGPLRIARLVMSVLS